MRIIARHRVRCWSSIASLLFTLSLHVAAEPVPVRHLQGTIHAFLKLRSEDGRVLAYGDLVQVTHGGQVTSRTVFHFKDGSIDDETTVFSQRHNLVLITDHHIQKGSFFPHPMDLLIDCRNSQVTVRATGKDGKEEVKTHHLDLPPELANGIVPTILENMPPGSAETTVPMLVATPKPRIVKLVVSRHGEESFSIGDSSHLATRYEIKIELGGIPGVVAPLIGKQPPNIQVWVIGGQAPTFLRERGPLYAEGPVTTIELASPAWPASSESGK